MYSLQLFSSSNNKSTLASMFEVQIMYVSSILPKDFLFFLNLEKSVGF